VKAKPGKGGTETPGLAVPYEVLEYSEKQNIFAGRA
jgi:hypothetical protein